jgi:hypothetical protein
VVFACLDRTLLRALILMREHVRFQVFEDLSAIGIRAAALLSGFFAAEVVLATVRLDRLSSGRWIGICGVVRIQVG